jgi:alpha-glucosidase
MSTGAPWWRNSVIYQIYVRSWRDSNGDGVGDLAGICERLDYLQWLGVNALWLSPTMPSPNRDWGYDVSDYYDVHPALGTLEDLDRLIAEAAEHEIGVMLDLVPNHTSSAHAWFVDALSGPGAEHRDYYVWAPPAADGGPPNNWLCATGASAWTIDDQSGQYYLHNFLPTQPDLNWWNPDVHQEFEAILRFWCKRGVAGFRIDVAHGLYKDALLRDDPPPRPSDHPIIREAKLRPEYSSHRPEVHEVYRSWRQIVDGYEAQPALLGETWEFDYQRFGDYYGRQAPELHMAFNFAFVEAQFRAPVLAGVVESSLAALPAGATPVWTASNHDVGRFASRWCAGDLDAVKTALVVLATLPGTLVLYYGDELGMTDVDVPPAQRLDEMTMGLAKGRDRCRTPMPWSNGANAGFTPATARPWLPLGDYTTINVGTETEDPASVLSFWRQLAALRQAGRIGGSGRLERVLVDDQVWSYRVGAVTTVANLSAEEAVRQVPGSAGLSALASCGAVSRPATAGSEVRLPPWGAVVLGPRD